MTQQYVLAQLQMGVRPRQLNDKPGSNAKWVSIG